MTGQGWSLRLRVTRAIVGSAHVSAPVDFDQFTAVVRQIDDFFGNVAELPE